MVRQGLPTDRHPNVIFFLAYPHIQEIAVIVILCHPDRIPGDRDFISIPHRPNVLRRGVEGVGNGEQDLLDPESTDIPQHIHHIWGDPAEIPQAVEFYI